MPSIQLSTKGQAVQRNQTLFLQLLGLGFLLGVKFNSVLFCQHGHIPALKQKRKQVNLDVL